MSKITPMLSQYHRIKKEHKEAILFFRVGDFYETFYEDAVTASKVLNITLTSREHGKGNKIPLAGIPYHALDRYVTRLIKAGYKVAICDQLEDAALAKGIVKRDITEVITPGTVLRPSLLKEKENNYLIAIIPDNLSVVSANRALGQEKKFGLAAVDLSTGEFLVSEIEHKDLREEINRFAPSEIILPNSANEDFLSFRNFHITKKEDYHFDFNLAYEKLLNHFKTASLAGFGCEEMRTGISAAGAILAYLEENQKTALNHIYKISPYTPSGYLLLDQATKVNLEITSKIRGEGEEGTLLSILDQTKTPLGARKLRGWLLAPLLNLNVLKNRQEATYELIKSTDLRNNLTSTLSQIQDLERLCARISCGRANARDIKALENSVDVIPQVINLLEKSSSVRLNEIKNNLFDFSDLVNLIDKSIVDSPPLSLTEGGIIKEGYDVNLDELRNLMRSGKEWIAKLQEGERKKTGIQSLKVGFNNVFGYYIEVTKPNLHLVPAHYVRKQTIANGERFITPELKEYESKVLGAEEKIKRREYELFLTIRDEIGKEIKKILQSAAGIAELDVFNSLAIVAVENNYVRPIIDEGDEIRIIEGRHPVVEKTIERGTFVPNDSLLDNQENQIIILTGPNMAGKSTYLRQIALIVIMAQIGSFVPAKEARIGLVDRIFTRIGASDDLAKGVSTFLAEMQETANILNNATTKSLVLLDEIGRGTSTFDGLSIAWAVTEFLHHRLCCKTLFATHYHELTELSRELLRVKNYNVTVKEWGDEIIFLRKVVSGGSDQSYGIQVARLAGLPKEVIERAKEILANLEADELTPTNLPKLARGSHAPTPELAKQLTLFIPAEHPILEELRKLELEKMTPLEALNKLEELKRKINK
ncbi:MAG: DNA mismatch repair protein MutS [Candidatus Edwardsbacteria bacterium]